MKRSKFIQTIIGLPIVIMGLSFKNKSYGKVIFTPEMLTRNNFGLFIINTRVKEITEQNIGYAATVSWKLSYTQRYWKNSNGVIGEFAGYGKVNFLTDGWFCPIGNTYEEVCKYLNNNPHGESFRLMTKEEVLYIITHRKQGFL